MINALRAGQTLKKPVFWKKVQMALAMLAGFMPLAITFFPELQAVIDKDLITKIDSGIAGIIVYLTVATTDKLGT